MSLQCLAWGLVQGGRFSCIKVLSESLFPSAAPFVRSRKGPALHFVQEEMKLC